MLSTKTTIKNFVSGGDLFAADFKIIDTDTVHVHFIDEDGIEQTELDYVNPPTDNTEFNITDITDSGFNVNLGANSDANGVISVRRVVDEDQITHWPTGGAFPASTHERSADKLTMLIQQMFETIKRVVRTPLHEGATNMVIPELADRKDGIMGFDSDGLPQMRAGFLPKVYDPLYTYSTDIIIQYDGHFFICLQQSTGNTPVGNVADAYWVQKNFDGINWQNEIYFMTGDITEYDGYLFKSLDDDNLNNTPTSPGGDSNWERIYTQGPVGEINPYVADTEYFEDEVVTDSSLMYISLQDGHTGNTPASSPTYWKIFPIAVDIPITDSGGKIIATEVEGALQENRIALDVEEAALVTHKAADGKEHSDVVLNNTYRTESFPIVYDLTSSNATKTLPEITGLPQIVSWHWKNGDGTYKVTPAVTDGALIGGLAASIWEGESNGHMVVESDGTNWQVRDYNDSDITVTDSWIKHVSGKLECWKRQFNLTGLTSAAKGALFETNASSVWTFPHVFVGSPPAVSIFAGVNSGVIPIWARLLTADTTSCDFRFVSTASITSSDFMGSAIGKWK